MRKKRPKFVFGSITCAFVMLAALIMGLFTGCLEDEETAPTASVTTTVAKDIAEEKAAENDGSVDVSEISDVSDMPESIVRSQQVDTANAQTVTILMYWNGSNLESEDGEGTTDMAEILKAGSSPNVNILIQTMGTSKWKNYGIASDHSQIYKVEDGGLTLVNDDLGQLDCTSPDTLSDFISWGAENYPADRYILTFWNHGGGSVYGFGYDEFQDEDAALTIDEMAQALQTAGVYFDFIGMDCCIMSSLEVCCALYDYCDYTILSEDFESGLGWSYTKWISELYDNPAISTEELGKTIVDSMVGANKSSSYGDNAILAVIDESVMKLLFTTWMDFAYENADTLINQNYSQKVTKSSRALPGRRGTDFFSDWLSNDSEVTMSDYYITDIMSVASSIDTDKSAALSSALDNAIVYTNSCGEDTALTGLSVTLPYGDSSFYNSLKTIYANCGFDSDYITWLKDFVGSDGATDFYDYSDFDDSWDSWDDSYDDDYDWGDWDFFSNFDDTSDDSTDTSGDSDFENFFGNSSENDESYDNYDDFFDDYFDWGDNWDYDDSYNAWCDDDFDYYSDDYDDSDYEDDYSDDYDDYSNFFANFG